MIVKAEHTAKGSNPRFLVTNLTGAAQELYEKGFIREDWVWREDFVV